MDSHVLGGKPIEAIARASFNSIEWILTPLGDIVRGFVRDELSIPLNGFGVEEGEEHNRILPSFNSIEWILKYC